MGYLFISRTGCIGTVSRIVAIQKRTKLNGLNIRIEGDLGVEILIGKCKENRAGTTHTASDQQGGQEMKQVRIVNNVFIPMPVVLVGCRLGGRDNFMAAGWVSRVNADPPWIGIGINRTHATPAGILDNKSFSVCFPGHADIAKVDYCGLVSGERVDKSSLFTVFYGDLKTAPLIEEASLNLECTLVQTIEGPSNFFFIGEIIGAYAPPHGLANGVVNPEKADYLLLTMPDNTYRSLGESIARAWDIGRTLMGE